MQVWVTKHALTAGIGTCEVKEPTHGTHTVVDRSQSWPQYFHGEGKDWHRTWTGALKRAEEMRIAKIKSLEKSIKKLRGMSFDPP
jgi:hypothetical protein